MSSRPVHFEIHAVDPERMAAFYSELFGWTIQKWEVCYKKNKRRIETNQRKKN